MIIAIVLCVVVAGLAIGGYNTLVRKRNQTDNAFGLIDAMLKKRFDLVPNLVACVQRYAEHEQATFSQVVRLRENQYDSLSVAQKEEFDRAFSAARRQFLAVAENYPQLRASENFMQLQRTLNETEEQLSAARRTYNACVTDYNNTVMTFPSNLIAGMFGFTRREVLSVSPEERESPDVRQMFRS